MKIDNPLLDKSLCFAARIIRLNKYLVKEKRETVISKQIIRSATSIGANANEAIYGISKADFIEKLQISLKETAETEYWLRLLVLSEYITEDEHISRSSVVVYTRKLGLLPKSQFLILGS